MEETDIRRIIEEGKICIRTRNSDEVRQLVSLFRSWDLCVMGINGRISPSDYKESMDFWGVRDFSDQLFVGCIESPSDLPLGIMGLYLMYSRYEQPTFIY